MTEGGSSITTYVPQIASQYFPFPLLAYQTDNFNEKLLGWKDDEKGYAWYDITEDAWSLLRKFRGYDGIKQVFSKIHYWELPSSSVRENRDPDGDFQDGSSTEQAQKTNQGLCGNQAEYGCDSTDGEEELEERLNARLSL